MLFLRNTDLKRLLLQFFAEQSDGGFEFDRIVGSLLHFHRRSNTGQFRLPIPERRFSGFEQSKLFLVTNAIKEKPTSDTTCKPDNRQNDDLYSIGDSFYEKYGTQLRTNPFTWAFCREDGSPMYSFLRKISIANMNRFFLVAGLTVGLLNGMACGGTGDSPPNEHDSGVRIVLEGADDRRLLSFYIGGMVSDEGQDPFEAGFVEERSGRFYLILERISARLPELGSSLVSAAEDGAIDWAELEPIIQAHYYDYRPIPRSIADLRTLKGDWRASGEWFSFEVNGVMSSSIRRIHVPKDALISALSSYRESGDRIMYNAGTTFISEHVEGDRVLEVSALTKRNDGYWDFYAYDESGEQTTRIRRDPTDLTVPTRCVGCHFGNRLFEPERSFPAESRPGPNGPRKMYVSEELKNADVVRMLDEHRKRSDTILGLYGTLFISQLKATSDLSSDLKDLLDRAGF